MEIINQYHEYLGVCPMDVKQNLKNIELFARECYQSQDRVTPDSYNTFCAMLQKRKHTAMLEHSNIVMRLAPAPSRMMPRKEVLHDMFVRCISTLNSKFLRFVIVPEMDCMYIGGNIRAWMEEIGYDRDLIDIGEAIRDSLRYRCISAKWAVQDISMVRPAEFYPVELTRISVRFTTNRAMTHELVRHRMDVAFAQLSQRFVRHTGDIKFIQPVGMEDNVEFMDIFKKSCAYAELQYQALLATKRYTPQQARNVLTNAVSSRIVMTTDLEEWEHIFKLRCAPDADPQMQDLMCPVRDLFIKRRNVGVAHVQETCI